MTETRTPDAAASLRPGDRGSQAARAGRLALANAGVRSADAQPALDQARAVKTSDEVTALRANARVCEAKNEASHRVFGSPHLPVPIPQQPAADEPIEPCAPRDIFLATAWIIAWALTVFILANVLGSI